MSRLRAQWALWSLCPRPRRRCVPSGGVTVEHTGRRSGVTRRLSLAGQLLALQVVIICVVLVGVASVTVAQSTERARETEGREALAVAETVANTRLIREALEHGEETYVRVVAENSRSVSGSGSVVVADVDG